MSTRIQAHNYLYQTDGHDPQPIYQNREQLLSRSKQYGVSISINVFNVYMLKLIDIITIPTSLYISHD